MYFLVGMSARIFVLPKEEIFPIFSWSLFSYVPSVVYNYDVQILRYKNLEMKPPILYHEAEKIVPKAQEISAYIVIQAWGKALAKKDYEQAKKQQAIFERIYLLPKTKYQVVLIKYNPITRWQNNTMNIVPIAVFSKK